MVWKMGKECGNIPQKVGELPKYNKLRYQVTAIFADATYSRVEKEKDNGFWEYEVWLSDGSQVEFNEKGEWTSVECKYSEMPVGIIPTVIAEDIAKRYPDLKPYKIEKEVGGYEIDIPGYDLYYSYNGMFIRAEIDK